MVGGVGGGADEMYLVPTTAVGLAAVWGDVSSPYNGGGGGCRLGCGGRDVSRPYKRGDGCGVGGGAADEMYRVPTTAVGVVGLGWEAIDRVWFIPNRYFLEVKRGKAVISCFASLVVVGEIEVTC